MAHFQLCAKRDVRTPQQILSCMGPTRPFSYCWTSDSSPPATRTTACSFMHRCK